MPTTATGLSLSATSSRPASPTPRPWTWLTASSRTPCSPPMPACSAPTAWPTPGWPRANKNTIGGSEMPKISHRRGELLALSSGGASSYECSGLYRVLNDLSLGDLAEQYCRQAAYRERTLQALNKGMLSIEEITLLEAQGIYNQDRKSVA